MAPLVFLLLLGQTLLCTAIDTISSTTPLFGAHKIVSQGSNFTLGFYSPPESYTDFFLAIWYSNILMMTTVWTATTYMRVSDPTTTTLVIGNDGNLVLFDQSKNQQLWSTNVSISSNSTMAILRDSGSLDLIDTSNSSIVYWRSIDHPTNTWLPGGKLGLNKATGVSQRLVSWRNNSDPSPGLFSLELDPNGTPQFFIQWNDSISYWRVVPEMTANFRYDFRFINNATERYFIYSMKDDSVISRFIIDIDGHFKQLIWGDSYQTWILLGSQPRTQCEVYALCGAYGSCSLNALPFCNCIKGFSQQVQSDRDLQYYSGGCKRNAPLQCQTNSSSAQTKSDKFYIMAGVRLPDNARGAVATTSQECEMACLINCSCNAYTYNSTGCFVWHGDLVNLQERYNGNGGGTLLLRLAASELPDGSDPRKRKTTINGAVVGGVAAVFIILAIVLFVLFQKCRRERTLWVTKIAGGTPIAFRYNDLLDDIRSIDSLLLDLSTLRVATDEFDEGNMLGKGGFGMVHKGVLPDGTQIAVKRLCQSSRQGIEELKSELVLVAKLRHRNLVSLIGVCMEEQEKILVYEFMPNRSLDTILFDSGKSKGLDWGRRLKIINGVAKGLQYLHEDSQLKIVHRDLKASNILLDFDYNPKISDFGLAKIFGGDQSEDVTSRIVGTYGYMAPEYAMHGQYSTKSDAFSFGVLVLEIVTGRRNNGSCNSEQYIYLVNLVWEHWTRGNVIELVDPSLSNHPPLALEQVLKCIQIGLLCVEKRPENRPTMSSVNVMLSSHSIRLPSVSVPAFCDRLNGCSDNSKVVSSTGMTITELEPR